MKDGIIFDIERFSVHDGPGIRTVVYLKGCPLKCPWCANPESQLISPQIGYVKGKCIGCMSCVQVCPNAQTFIKTHYPDWSGCSSCMQCVQVCLAGARVCYGRRMNVEEVVAEICKDLTFYKNFGGGVTLSGGESCLQADFAAAILAQCKENGINTALDTCGYIPWNTMEKVLRHVDYLLYDIKHMDTVEHKKFIGVGNELIIENAQRACTVVNDMIIRVPVIPGFNESEEHMCRLEEFVRTKLSSVKSIELLPYHSAGESKCAYIGRKYEYADGGKNKLSVEYVERLKKLMEKNGLHVCIGG